MSLNDRQVRIVGPELEATIDGNTGWSDVVRIVPWDVEFLVTQMKGMLSDEQQFLFTLNVSGWRDESGEVRGEISFAGKTYHVRMGE